MKKNQKVKILIDDNSPVKRFSRGNTGVITKVTKTVSDSSPKPYLVKLDQQPFLGTLKVSKLVYFNKKEIQLL